jgi:hypothetical protein
MSDEATTNEPTDKQPPADTAASSQAAQTDVSSSDTAETSTPETTTDNSFGGTLTLPEKSDPDTDTGEATEQEERLFAGKYKTPEELEKGYTETSKQVKELQTKLEGLRAEKEIPETYEYAEVFEQNGLTPLEGEQAEEAMQQFFEQARDAGFSQTQFNKMVEMGSSWLREQLQALTPQADLQATSKTLKEEGYTDDYLMGLSKWAHANLPMQVFTKPLKDTPEGIKLIEQMRNDKAPAQPMTNSSTPSEDVDDLRLKLRDYMADPEYNKNSKAGIALQSKADAVSKRISALERKK